MSTVIKQNAILNFGVAMFSAGTTSELTGLTASAITMYAWYSSTGTVVNIPNTGVTAFSWTEVSPSNMPCLYSVSLPATYTNVGTGEMVIYIYSTTSAKSKRDFIISTANPLTDVWDELRSNHLQVGTMVEMARVCFLSQKGHIKLNTTTNTYILYAEDGVTPLFTCATLGPNGQPLAIGSTERLQGTP